MIKSLGGEENAEATVGSYSNHVYCCLYGFWYEHTTGWLHTWSRRTTGKGSERIDGFRHLDRRNLRSLAPMRSCYGFITNITADVDFVFVWWSTGWTMEEDDFRVSWSAPPLCLVAWWFVRRVWLSSSAKRFPEKSLRKYARGTSREYD